MKSPFKNKKLDPSDEEIWNLYNIKICPLIEELILKYKYYHKGINCKGKMLECLFNDIRLEYIKQSKVKK